MSTPSLEADPVIDFTLAGMIPTGERLHDVLVSVEEIIEDVNRAEEIGRTRVHPHARDDDGHSTHKEGVYGVSRIRKDSPERALCASLSGQD